MASLQEKRACSELVGQPKDPFDQQRGSKSLRHNKNIERPSDGMPVSDILGVNALLTTYKVDWTFSVGR